MDVKPDTIKVSAFHKEEIFASYANLYVTVKGASIISGNEAMKKAREVSQLVDALTRFGLGPDSIQLQGVRIDTTSGVLLKSSSAMYSLKIKNEKLEQLPALLDIITEQKNAALERVEWKYPEEAARDRGLEAAIALGKTKAEKVAQTLGVRLLGVYDFMENTFDEGPVPYQVMEMGMAARAKSAAEPSLNMDIQHSKIIQVHVDLWYRVSPL